MAPLQILLKKERRYFIINYKILQKRGDNCLMKAEKGELMGPIFAESLADEEVIDLYITSSEKLEDDRYLGYLLNADRVVLTGVRGTGKTMILKTGDVLLRKDLMHKLHYVNEWERDKRDYKILPVYISYSGFKEEVTLQNDRELNGEEQKIAKEIFRSYFFMTILQHILATIESLELDQEIEFNFFGIFTKLGIKREIDKTIKTFRRRGFRELILSQSKGVDVGIKISNFGVDSKHDKKMQATEVVLDDMHKNYLFKETIKSICSTYKLDKIMLLFDEVHYLKFLQSEFFDCLFGFRAESQIAFAISVYPTYMDYGEQFDIPDDAKEVPVSNALYRPNKEEYEKPLIKLVKKRIETYRNCGYEEVVSYEALALLILLVNGNPRLLLQSIEFLWTENDKKKIQSTTITQKMVEKMANSWYLEYCSKQAKRYKTSYDKAIKFVKVLSERLLEYNKRNDNVTNLFLLNEKICRKYSDTLELLVYCRIIDKMGIASFGGSLGDKGTLYSLNCLVGWYYGIFSKKQIANLVGKIKASYDKDSKVQFDSIKLFDTEVDIIQNNSCPRLIDSTCTNPKCQSFFSEEWEICPYYPNLSLEISIPCSDDISIEELGISERMAARLHEKNINTLHDILVVGVDGLKEVPFIKNVRANYFYYLAKEYVDDNL